MASRIRATDSLRDELMIAQKSLCAHCGNRLRYHGNIPLFDVDHKIQFALSGDNNFDNLQLLCVECHRIKSVSERRIKTEPNPAQKYVRNNIQRIKLMNNPFAKYALYSEPDMSDLDMNLLDISSELDTQDSVKKLQESQSDQTCISFSDLKI